MSKFFRKVLWLGALTGIGYAGFKMYQKISAISKLSKSLPEFLNNVYGEKPKININMDLKSLKISVGFKQDVLDNNEDIQTTVTEYIEDFYPVLSKCKLTIDIFAVKVTDSAKQNDCDCGSDCECDEHEGDCDCGDDCNCDDEKDSKE
ncbi:hypothetical protein JEZ13_04470 [bacterium]|nr:hypothetical protein [bacterium]